MVVPKWAIPVGGVVLAGLVGFTWLREHDARVRAEGRAETLSAQVDSLRAVAEDAVAQVASKDSAVALQKGVIALQQKQLDEIIVVARRQTQAAVASLRDELDDRQNAMLDTITAGFERQLAAKDSMHAAQVRLTALAYAQVASRDTALAKIQQASSVVYDAWQAEKKRASPGLITKAIRAIPVVATAVGITLLVKK